VAFRGIIGPMPEISIRLATSADIQRIEEIRLQHAYPGHIALMGSVDLAKRYGSGRTALDRIPNRLRVTVVAEISGRVEGVLQYTYGADVKGNRLEHLRLLLSLLGPMKFVRRLRFLRARSRVNIPVPTDAFRVFNLQVDIAHRRQGIATSLLDWAEGEAARLGARRMALLADLTNPAIRLYEREGYVTTRTATDRQYERYSQDAGRVLMEKDLTRADRSASES
jgi:ribosomal protein S18 acetylase RimI-like enzyme